ncbi:MAG: glycosyltransferase family 9 protein [Bacteroidota bacterium]
MKKILVIRFSSIGDVVLASPVLRHLHHAEPDAEIHFLIKKKFVDTVFSNPNIHTLHSFDRDPLEILEELKNENFDLVIDLQKNIRSRRIRRALGKPSRKLNKFNIRKWKMVRFKCRKLRVPHITDRYLETAGFSESQNDGKGLDFYISEKDNNTQTNFPAHFSDGYIGIVIGAAHATKCFPADKIISLCKYLDYPVILLGGPTDREVGEKISKACGELVFNACGIFTLGQSAALIKNAKVVISPDTGLMHISAALHKPLISIWGNTIPEFGMYPYYPKGMENRFVIEEVKGLPCRPCSKIGYAACPKQHFRCMNLLDEARIASLALEMVTKDKD